LVAEGSTAGHTLTIDVVAAKLTRNTNCNWPRIIQEISNVAVNTLFVDTVGLTVGNCLETETISADRISVFTASANTLLDSLAILVCAFAFGVKDVWIVARLATVH
jgi:hypothetical protein